MIPRSPSFRPWDEEVTQSAHLLMPFARHSSLIAWNEVADKVDMHIMSRGASVEHYNRARAAELYRGIYEDLGQRFDSDPVLHEMVNDSAPHTLAFAYLGLCSEWRINEKVTMAEVAFAANVIYSYTSRKDFDQLMFGVLSVAEVAYVLSEARRQFFLSLLDATTIGLHRETYSSFAPERPDINRHMGGWWHGRRIEFKDGESHIVGSDLFDSVPAIKHAAVREPALSSGRSEDAMLWLWLGSYSFPSIIERLAEPYEEKVVNTIDSVRRSVLWIPAGREIARLSLDLRPVGWWNVVSYLEAGITDPELIGRAVANKVAVDTLLSVV